MLWRFFLSPGRHPNSLQRPWWSVLSWCQPLSPAHLGAPSPLTTPSWVKIKTRNRNEGEQTYSSYLMTNTKIFLDMDLLAFSPLFPPLSYSSYNPHLLLLTGCQQVKKWLDTTEGETITHGCIRRLCRHWEPCTPLRSLGHVFLIKRCTGGIIKA